MDFDFVSVYKKRRKRTWPISSHLDLVLGQWYISLLNIMCGYQCDRAVNKNDTREVIWCHFTAWNDIISPQAFEFSNQVDCNNLVDTNRVTRYSLSDAGRQIWGEEVLWREELLSSFINAFLYFNLVAWFFLSMSYIINKLLHVKSLISFLFTRF